MNECHIKVMAENGNQTIIVRGNNTAETAARARLIIGAIKYAASRPVVITMVSQTR